jgi:hypothetical protein
MLSAAHKEKTRLLLASNFSVSSLSLDCAQKSRDVLLKTVEKKFGALPKEARQHQPYETPDGRVRIIADQDNTNIWAIRYSEPDKSKAGRDWIVECLSVVFDGQVHFSLRLSCFSESYDFTFLPSTPGPLKEVTSQMQAHVGDLTMSPHVRVIGDDANVSDLQKELEHKDRWWNTIVVSECKNPNRGIDIDALQRNLLGCANIYFLPEAHEFDFVEAVGDEHRVYGGAARSFRPRFRAGETQSTANPVIRAPWKTNDFFSERALHILSLDAFETSTRRIALNRDAPGFADARQFVAQQRLVGAGANNDQGALEHLTEALEAAREEAEIAQSLGAQAEDDRRQIEASANDLEARNTALLGRVSALEAALKAKGVAIRDQHPPTLSEFPEWVSKSFAGRLSLHPRAIRPLKRALYEDVELVAQALELLATEYVDMRSGILEQKDFETSLHSLGLTLSPSISASRMGETGDEYLVVHKGRKTPLELHLKKGTSRDQRYQLRIYFLF